MGDLGHLCFWAENGGGGEKKVKKSQKKRKKGKKSEKMTRFCAKKRTK